MVVNDLGASSEGGYSDATPAQQGRRRDRRRRRARRCDYGSVADFAEAKALIDQARREFGSLDVLVNNAGILRGKMAST